MMKIVLQHPSGLHIEFEGNVEDFDRFERFLTGDIGGFMQGLEERATEPIHGASGDDGEGQGDSQGDGGERVPTGKIDPHALYERLTALDAKTDIERVTVIAQFAIDAGLEGIDSELGNRLYDALGIPKPSRWAKAFSNAKARGLLRSVKHGTWRPTVNGENYVKFGVKPSAPRRKRGPGNGSDRLTLETGEDS